MHLYKFIDVAKVSKVKEDERKRKKMTSEKKKTGKR